MRISDILDDRIDSSYKTLQTECSKFFSESGGLPLFKSLSETYPDFHRVKVRHNKRDDAFSTSLDMAFESERTQFSQRAIFASGMSPTTIDSTSFYVFPTNGFNFLYNTVVNETNEHSLHAFDSIYERCGFEEGSRLIAEVLKFSYTPLDLQEGLKSGAEIILYGIPSYYAVRINSVGNYENVLTSVLEV